MGEYDYLYCGENETLIEYKARLYKNRTVYGLRWKQISELLNSQFGLSTTDESCRGEWRTKFRTNVDEVLDNPQGSIGTVNNENISPNLSIDNRLDQIKIEKMKLSDLVTQNNAIYRSISREQTLKDIAVEVANIIGEKKLLNHPNIIRTASNTNKEGILLLSDWHFGLEFDNFINSYSPSISKQRISNLLCSVITYCEKHHISKLNVCILGDLISGNIHLPLRIQSRVDVITQTMTVAEILSEFINELSNYCHIDVYSCTDNHSRVDSNKKESLQIESFARFIPWYLKARLIDNANVNIKENAYGLDIINFTCLGFNVCGVHGHKDSTDKIVNNLSHITQQHFDLVLTAHLHSFAVMEDDTVVIRNGSLMGTDDYAIDLRKRAKPSQTLLIVSADEILYDIKKLSL